MLAKDLYDGNISSIPSNTTGMMKLLVVHLRIILLERMMSWRLVQKKN